MPAVLQMLHAVATALVLHAVAAPAAAATTVTIAESRAGEPLMLGDTPVSIALAPRRALDVRPGEQVYLLLERLHAEGAVEASFELYVGLPAGAAPQRDGPHYVADFNFFDAESGRRNLSFNITRLLAALAAAGGAPAPIVTIVPNGHPAAAAQPSIGHVRIVSR
jgi:hypothetical protein